MLENYRLKRIMNIIKIFSMGIVLLISLMLLTSEKKLKKNIVDNKKYFINSVIDIEDKDVDKGQNIEEESKKEDKVINTFSGDLTGYSADCPACYGTLGCLPSYNVYRNGVLTYPDKTYGNVRIVASSKSIPCGSIIRFDSDRVSDGTTYAIILDRGVYNYDIDLLVPTEAFAYQYIGRSKIKYDVLRYGW